MILDISIAQNSMCCCSIFHCEKSLLPITFYLLRKKFTNGKRNCLKHYADNEHVCVDENLYVAFCVERAQKVIFLLNSRLCFSIKKLFLSLHNYSEHLMTKDREWNQQRESFPHPSAIYLDSKVQIEASFSCLLTTQKLFVQNNNLKFVPLKNTYFITTSNLKRTLE